jgi:hypothetical protein
MTNLINKSSHPVEVKKVRVKIWALRDEIETAISNRIKEDGGDFDEVFIEDIKDYYHSLLANTNEKSEDDDDDNEETDDNLDASGNPMDDDAAMMMQAMGGGEEAPAGAEVEADDAAAKMAAEMLGDQAVAAPSEESSEEEDKPAEASAEDEAAKMAAEMLGDQGAPTPPAELSPEDEAAKMASEMLGDQGGAPASAVEATPSNEADDAAAQMAADMLADQGGSAETVGNIEEVAEVKTRKPFGRVMPPSEKVVTGEVLLSDIQMNQILMFTDGEFLRGQNIIIQFLVTRPFTVSGEIFNVHHYGRNSKIIKENKLGYRIQSTFSFQFPEERNNLRSFLTSVEPTIPPQPKKIVRDDDGEGDDDFDDLGF